MSIIGQAYKHAATWNVTLSTEVSAFGITVGKTEQAARNLFTCIRKSSISNIDWKSGQNLRSFRDMPCPNRTNVLN